MGKRDMRPMYRTAAEERLILAAIKSYRLLLKVREPEYSDAVYRSYKKAGKDLEEAVKIVTRERRKKATP